MSTFKIQRNKVLRGGEARAVAAAVARARRAGEVKRLTGELARTVRSAERSMAVRMASLEPVTGAIGLPVPAAWIMCASEGLATSERMGRFVFLRPNPRAPLLLPPWSVDNMALTKTGIASINRHTRLRPFTAIRSDLMNVLESREREARTLLCRIPRGATVATVLQLYPAHTAHILKALSHD